MFIVKMCGEIDCVLMALHCKALANTIITCHTNRLRNKYAIITSKRRFAVVITYSLRAIFAA